MIKSFYDIQHFSKRNKWLTYVNHNWIKWIYKNETISEMGFEHTDMSDIDSAKREFIMMREDEETLDGAGSVVRHGYKRIVYNDNGSFKVTNR